MPRGESALEGPKVESHPATRGGTRMRKLTYERAGPSSGCRGRGGRALARGPPIPPCPFFPVLTEAKPAQLGWRSIPPLPRLSPCLPTPFTVGCARASACACVRAHVRLGAGCSCRQRLGASVHVCKQVCVGGQCTGVACLVY